MKRICAIFLLILIPSFCLFSLEIRVNNSFYAAIGAGGPAGYPALRYAGEHAWPALEIIPPMEDLREITLTFENGRTESISGGPLEEFSRWRFRQNGGSWSLVTSGMVREGLRALNITGEQAEQAALSVWLSWEGAGEMAALIRRYADIHGLETDIQTVPSLMSKITSVARGRGRIPDLFMVQSDNIPELTSARLIQRLDGLNTEDIAEKGIQAFRREGALWALPMYFDTQLVFCNPHLVSPPPPDWTLADFEEILENLAERGISPVTWNAYSAYWLIPFQIGFGKNGLVNADGSLTVNDAPTRDALNYLLDLQDRGLLDIREREGMTARFISGEVGMILSGSYSIPAFDGAGVSYFTAPFPEPLSPLLDFKGLAVSRRTYHTAQARTLALYLADPGVQDHFSSRIPKMPASSRALSAAGAGLQAGLTAGYDRGTVIPPGDVYPVFKNTMWKLLSFAFTGQLETNDLLEQGQIIIDEKIQRRTR